MHNGVNNATIDEFHIEESESNDFSWRRLLASISVEFDFFVAGSMYVA